jgi:hypothetical protein
VNNDEENILDNRCKRLDKDTLEKVKDFLMNMNVRYDYIISHKIMKKVKKKYNKEH